MAEEKSSLDKIAKFLYNNVPIREAIVNGKRCNYFKGTYMFGKCLGTLVVWF